MTRPRPGEPAGAAVNESSVMRTARVHDSLPIDKCFISNCRLPQHQKGYTPPVDAQPVEPLTAEDPFRKHTRETQEAPPPDLLTAANAVVQWAQYSEKKATATVPAGFMRTLEAATLDAARAGDGLLREDVLAALARDQANHDLDLRDLLRHTFFAVEGSER